MKRIILASKSPRRKKLLEQLGYAFEIYPSSIEELAEASDPENMVEELALQKAEDVASYFEDSLVIGADTIVVFEGDILGKPEDEEHAFRILKKLSGNTHFVYSGVAFVKTDKNEVIVARKTFHEQTKVRFSTLSVEEIHSYVKTGSPMDKAGAYGIQDDWGAVFVEHLEGDYYNVVGFPVNRFYQELKHFSPDLVTVQI